MKNFIKYLFSAVLVSLVLVKCTEPYQLETSTFEDALVVEGSITNELSIQMIKISHVIRLEEEESITENNAQVWVEDSNQNKYYFSESEPGIYLSDEAFQAQPNLSYQLFIKTSNGNLYESRAEYLTPSATISDLYAEAETVNGENGIQIYVDSNEDVGSAKYFRYEYDETYKVISPFTINLDVQLAVIQPLNYDITVETTTEEKLNCYTTESHFDIIQANISGSSGNKIDKLPIRFIGEYDNKISERYSIQVKQFVQSFDSYNYYKTLKELGNVESLLVENQTGFVHGNIANKDNQKEKVLGFFEVSSVSSERLYFNHEDFNFEKPDYPYICEMDTLDYRDGTSIDGDRNDRLWMYTILEQHDPPWELLDIEYIDGGIGPLGEQIFIPLYIFVTPQCGNCNTFSSNIKPEFWED